MAGSKFERFFVEMERAAEWLNENVELGKESGKTICIFVADEKHAVNSFAGTTKGLMVLSTEVEKMLEKHITKALIKSILNGLED